MIHDSGLLFLGHPVYTMYFCTQVVFNDHYVPFDCVLFYGTIPLFIIHSIPLYSSCVVHAWNG